MTDIAVTDNQNHYKRPNYTVICGCPDIDCTGSSVLKHNPNGPCAFNDGPQYIPLINTSLFWGSTSSCSTRLSINRRWKSFISGLQQAPDKPHRTFTESPYATYKARTIARDSRLVGRRQDPASTPSGVWRHGAAAPAAREGLLVGILPGNGSTLNGLSEGVPGLFVCDFCICLCTHYLRIC